LFGELNLHCLVSYLSTTWEEVILQTDWGHREIGFGIITNFNSTVSFFSDSFSSPLDIVLRALSG
jgi:hypothetical protein